MLTLTVPVRRPWPIPVTEHWFASEGDQLTEGPLLCPQPLRLFHATQRIGGLMGRWLPTRTLLTDLQALDTLEKRLGKTTRYEIRRAINRNEIQVEHGWSAQALVDFAASRDASNSNQPSLARLHALADKGALSITAGACAGEALCVHAYLESGSRARLLYSYSARPRAHEAGSKDFAALVGRVNKALHWLDMQRLSERGFSCYDWGGFSGRKDNGIDRFKMLFLGEPASAWRFDGFVMPRRRALAVQARHAE